MTGLPPLQRLAAFLASPIVSDPPAPAIGPAIAVGWATVELDRAVAELGRLLALAPSSFREAPPTAVLGARCLVAEAALPGGLSLALLEPNTEGRLAATLARLNEGPVVAWLSVEEWTVAAAALPAMGVRTGVPQPGPFGVERLVLDGPRHGPHRLLVEWTGTIQT